MSFFLALRERSRREDLTGWFGLSGVLSVPVAVCAPAIRSKSPATRSKSPATLFTSVRMSSGFFSLPVAACAPSTLSKSPATRSKSPATLFVGCSRMCPAVLVGLSKVLGVETGGGAHSCRSSVVVKSSKSPSEYTTRYREVSASYSVTSPLKVP